MSALLDAAVDAITAAHTGTPRVYEVNQVPAERPYPYSVVMVTPQAPDGYTLDQVHGFRDHQLVVQSFARLAEAVFDYDQKAATALLDQTLAADGWSCDPCRFQTSRQYRDADDSGVIGITTVYAFMAKES